LKGFQKTEPRQRHPENRKRSKWSWKF